MADVVHWAPRAVRRRGLWHFLKLVARSWKTIGGMPSEWYENTTAYELGLKEFGIRFPREYADTDRAYVRAWLVGFGSQLDEDTRSQITRWARDES